MEVRSLYGNDMYPTVPLGSSSVMLGLTCSIWTPRYGPFAYIVYYEMWSAAFSMGKVARPLLFPIFHQNTEINLSG